MATLYLDRAQIDLRMDGNALAVYEEGKRRNSIPLGMLERVVVNGRQTRFESGVLLKLAEAGVAMMFVGARSVRQAALVLGPRHNDVAVRISQSQRTQDTDFCTRWARALVESKVGRQHARLLKSEHDRPDARKPLYDARATVARIQTELSRGSPDISRIRGLEGSAARAYFQGLTAVFAPSLGFHGRNRRPPRDPVNAALSLGYTLVHFDAVRAAHAAGLDPLIGFYHRPTFGRESLASDLIEPLRPIVDGWVWQMFRDGILRESHFSTHHGGGCLLGKAGREHFYRSWEPFARVQRRWLRIRCAQLARDLRREGESEWTDLDCDGS